MGLLRPIYHLCFGLRCASDDLQQVQPSLLQECIYNEVINVRPYMQFEAEKFEIQSAGLGIVTVNFIDIHDKLWKPYGCVVKQFIMHHGDNQTWWLCQREY